MDELARLKEEQDKVYADFAWMIMLYGTGYLIEIPDFPYIRVVDPTEIFIEIEPPTL